MKVNSAGPSQFHELATLARFLEPTGPGPGRGRQAERAQSEHGAERRGPLASHRIWDTSMSGPWRHLPDAPARGPVS